MERNTPYRRFEIRVAIRKTKDQGSKLIDLDSVKQSYIGDEIRDLMKVSLGENFVLPTIDYVQFVESWYEIVITTDMDYIPYNSIDANMFITFKDRLNERLQKNHPDQYVCDIGFLIKNIVDDKNNEKPLDEIDCLFNPDEMKLTYIDKVTRFVYRTEIGHYHKYCIDPYMLKYDLFIIDSYTEKHLHGPKSEAC